MPTVGEEIERRRERKEEEEQIKEQELEYQARLAAAQAFEQQRQRQAKQSRLKALAKQVARKEIKKAVKRRVAAWAARGIASALAAAAPYILPVLAVIAGIFLVIFIIIATIAVLCNPQGWGQNLAAAGVKLSGIISSETCQAFSGLGGVATSIQQGAAGLEACPRVTPPPGVRVECIDCLDMKAVAAEIPISPNSNSLANRNVIDRLRRLVSINQTFRVTEAFCPTAFHQDHDHFNGFSVDINLKPELIGDRAKLAQLYNDAVRLGFSNIICEYATGYLSAFGINCGAVETTTAGHIHMEEPHGH